MNNHSEEAVFDTFREILIERFFCGEIPDDIVIDYDTRLEEDLGADSLDLVELVMNCEEEFELEDEIPYDEVVKALKTVGEVVGYLYIELNRISIPDSDAPFVVTMTELFSEKNL